MKKIVLLLAIAAIAAAPAAGQTRQKKLTKEQAEAADIAKQNDNTRRALRDALPLILPSWLLPVYFGMRMDEKMKAGDKKPVHAKAKQ